MATRKKTTRRAPRSLRVVVPGNPITKSNAYVWRRGKPRLSNKHESYELLIKDAAEKVLRDRDVAGFSRGPVRVDIVYYLENHKVKDLFNLPKTTADALNGNFYKDDAQIVEGYLSKRYDKENPRVEITVRRPSKWVSLMKALFWSLPPSLR